MKTYFMPSTPQILRWGIIAGTRSDRIAVVVRVNHSELVFYRSSKGTDGKKEGHWYPVFGLGYNWLIKGPVDEMERGYDRPAVMAVMHWLSNNFGSKDIETIKSELQSEFGDPILDEKALFRTTYGMGRGSGSGTPTGSKRFHPSETGMWPEIDAHIKAILGRLDTPPGLRYHASEEEPSIIEACEILIDQLERRLASFGITIPERVEFSSTWGHSPVFSPILDPSFEKVSMYMEQVKVSYPKFQTLYKSIHKSIWTIIFIIDALVRSSGRTISVNPKLLDHAKTLQSNMIKSLSEYCDQYLSGPNPHLAYGAKKILDGSRGLNSWIDKLQNLKRYLGESIVSPVDVARLLSEDIRVNNGFL